MHTSFNKVKMVGIGLIVLLMVGGLFIHPHTPKKAVHAITSSDTAASVGSTPDTSQDPSTSNMVTPDTSTSTSITPSVGSVTPLNYSSPTSTYTSPTSSSSGTTFTPDPSKCAGIRAQIDQINASYASQDDSLRTAITNYRNYITANGSGNTSVQQAAMQNDINQLEANVTQMNNLDAPLEQQLGANECS